MNAFGEGGPVMASRRGLRAARLEAIKADIASRLAQPGLSAASVAQRQGISDSYLRKLFDGDGTSFSDFVLNARLARAHRLLSDPRLIDRTIASIAFEVGFGDLSYFNRSFRRLYGAKPSDVRAAALSRRSL
jgi:AraC-like DNA-binding protein